MKWRSDRKRSLVVKRKKSKTIVFVVQHRNKQGNCFTFSHTTSQRKRLSLMNDLILKLIETSKILLIKKPIMFLAFRWRKIIFPGPKKKKKSLALNRVSTPEQIYANNQNYYKILKDSESLVCGGITIVKVDWHWHINHFMDLNSEWNF